MYNRKVRIPFLNKISSHFHITSDEPDEKCGSGVHNYHVEVINDAGETVLSKAIDFQKGALAEPFTSFNGLLSTVYLTILIDHLQSFQKGEYKNEETALAIIHLQEALNWLAYRADDRDSRNVLGKHEK